MWAGQSGQRWRSGLVRVMRCSENGDSLPGLGCALLRPALTVFLGKPGGSLDAHAASAVDSGKPEKKGARPATPHLAARNGLARFCWLLTVCSCVVVALLSARSPRLLMHGASWCPGRRSVPPNSIRTNGFLLLILNSLILYLRVIRVKHIHTHILTLTQASSPSTTVLDNHYLRELVSRRLLISAERCAPPLSSLALLIGLGLLFKNLLPALI